MSWRPRPEPAKKRPIERREAKLGCALLLPTNEASALRRGAGENVRYRVVNAQGEAVGECERTIDARGEVVHVYTQPAWLQGVVVDLPMHVCSKPIAALTTRLATNLASEIRR